MRRPAIEPRKLDSPGADALVNAEGNTGRGAIASTCSTLHHINPAMLRTAFHAIRRDAAPGVDGETWAHYEKALDCRIEVLHSNIHMLHRHMLMVVLMRLRQVQPDPYADQATYDQKLNGERLAQEPGWSVPGFVRLHETARNLSNKIARGAFTAGLFVMRLDVIGALSVRPTD